METNLLSNLSRAELKVLREILKGDASREIAKRLFVEEKTIKFHLTSIYKKTGCPGRGKLIIASNPYKDLLDAMDLRSKKESTP